MTPARALDYLQQGRNAFITGPAGSGKTTLLNNFIQWAHDQEKNIAITGSTGIAATHIGGTTIHSWAGIGIKDALTPYDMDELLQKQALHKRMNEVDVLIIDEISMLHSYRLDMVDRVMKVIRDSREPFGGVQVIFSGDFFQLPPVNRGSRNGGPTHYAFEAEVWRNMTDLVVCYLDQVFRQEEGDPLYAILNEMRHGQLSEESQMALEERAHEEVPQDAVVTHLYTHNVDVDALNAEKLKECTGEREVYDMTSKGRSTDVALLKKYTLAQEQLELREGAQVMFIRNNFQRGYVNGTLGTVTGFEFGMPEIETRDGKRVEVAEETWGLEKNNSTVAQIFQLPLRLAWAITVHKSQGMTLDAAVVDLSKSFAPGMGYVALSRVRSLNGLYLRGANARALHVDPIVVEQDAVFQQLSKAAEAAADRAE